MAIKSVPTLPVYPTSTTRKALQPSQLSSLQASISNALSAVLAVAASIESSPLAALSLPFVQSYVQDHAFTSLQAVIWDNLPVKSLIEKSIHAQVLHLAQVLAERGLLNDLKLLVDLAIVYARSSPSNIHRLFQTAVDCPGSSILQDVRESLVPLFTQILEAGQGLYTLRKTAECIYCFVLASNYSANTKSLLVPFTQNTAFLTALAWLYLPGLGATGRSYGGANALLSALSKASTTPTDPTEWTSIYITTKVTLLDSFHLLYKRLLADLAFAKVPREITDRTEDAFSALFAMMEVVADASSESSTPLTPFLNFTLLQDYQHTYDLSNMLARALKKAEERDARMDLLDSALNSVAAEPGPEGKKNPGALKLILCGSGLQRHPRAVLERNALGTYQDRSPIVAAASSSHSATSNQESEIELASKASQVLDLLPEWSSEYIIQLLKSSRYGGNVERIIEALLDGSAPSEDILEREQASLLPTGERYERHNVFDDEVVDLDSVQLGKKKMDQVQSTSDPAASFLREEMKADILRRVEIMDLASDDDLDEDDIDPFALGEDNTNKKKPRTRTTPFDDDELDLDDAAVRIPVADSDDDSVASARTADYGDGKTAEAILELAYVSDPAVFARDQNTRRSKARQDLKTRSGWDHEQIEGWAMMLERDPRKKDRLLQKHEFRGNRSSSPVLGGQGGAGPSQHQPGQRGGGGGGRGGGRGRGGRGAGGRGRGGGARGGGTEGGDRAYKDKNKASHGNHNRKRAHDKKVKMAGGPS